MVTRLPIAFLAVTLLVGAPAADASPPGDPFYPLSEGRPVSAVVLLDARGNSPINPSGSDQGQPRRYDTQAVLASLNAADFAVVRAYHRFPMAHVTLSSRRALDQLAKHPGVLAVFPDQTFELFLAQSLPLMGQTLASTLGYGGTGTTVAVFDTGVDYTRTDFGSCSAPATPASTCKVIYAADLAPQDNSRDANGHGTNVGGIVVGVAPQAKIAALDVFDGGLAYTTDLLEGFQWAIDNQTAYNIVAINMSLGSGKFSSPCDSTLTNPLATPIADAYAAGIVTVAASGNNAYSDGIGNPACTSLALSVGAVYDANIGSQSWGVCTDSATTADKIACFSNSASFLDVLAPGSSIIAAGYVASGTSQAAPHAAAALAVLRSVYPTEPLTTTVSRLINAGTPLLDSRNSVTKPRIDLIRAVGSVNDAFAQRVPLSGNAGNLTAVNYGATLEAGEPNHAGNSGGRSVWWSWTATASGSMTIHTLGSDFDTLLSVYTGSGVSSLTQSVANDNAGASTTSSVTFGAVAGQSYAIAVDGKGGASGVIQLNWSLQPTTLDEEIPFLPPLALVALALGLYGVARAQYQAIKKTPGSRGGR